MGAVKLSKRTIDALSVERGDKVFWDREMAGFGVRVYRTGRKVYCVQTRGPGGPKRATVGPAGEVSAAEARRQAAVLIDRIKRGQDPAPPEPEPELTVAGLAERYMRVHVEVNCRPGTVETFGRVVNLYILPALGHLPVGEVERAHVAALHDKMRDKPYQANQMVSVLAKMFRLPGWKREIALRRAPPGATVAGVCRRRIGNVPAIRAVAEDMQGREFDSISLRFEDRQECS